jgi:hypothetical protein
VPAGRCLLTRRLGNKPWQQRQREREIQDQVLCFSSPSEEGETQAEEEEEDLDLLTEEEDWAVRGNSLNPNSPLGRAVADACTELEDLGQLEKQVNEQAFELLKKLGVKTNEIESGPEPEKE